MTDREHAADLLRRLVETLSDGRMHGLPSFDFDDEAIGILVRIRDGEPVELDVGIFLDRVENAVRRLIVGYTDMLVVMRPPGRAEDTVAGERQRADALRDRLDAAQAELREAREAAEALRRAEDLRQGRGLLARLKAALRGG